MQNVDLIARNLERLIAEAGSNPSAVSKKAGLGHTAARDIITGKTRNPTMRTLQMIAGVLGVKVQVITGEAAAGFAESAADYTPASASVWSETSTTGPSRELLMQVFGSKLSHPEIFISHANAPSMGIFAGDLLVIDLGRRAEKDDIVLATLADLETGGATTLLRRYAPPFLISTEAGDRLPVLRLDNTGAVAVMGVVSTVIRL